jgi:hypothetical protein
VTTLSDSFPVADAPEPPAPPVDRWQVRFEVLAVLLTAAAAVTVLARLLVAFDEARTVRAFGDRSVDLLTVVRTAALELGSWSAGAVLLAFLLVTLSGRDRISPLGVVVLRVLVVLGLFLAGLAAFGAILVVLEDPAASGILQDTSADGFGGTASRIGWTAPLLLAATLSGYVSWCAFSTLGEIFPRPVADGDAGGSDAVVDAEEA